MLWGVGWQSISGISLGASVSLPDGYAPQYRLLTRAYLANEYTICRN
jgi:hypothetical protein